MESSFWKTKVTFYPELIAASLMAKEWDIYLCYCVLKEADRQCEGRGVVRLQPALRVINDLFGIRGNHAYTKIEHGIGKYWRNPGGKPKDRRFGLYSLDHVVRHLHPTMPRMSPFRLMIEDLLPVTEENSSAYMKSNFVAMIASRLGDTKPQSIASIQEHTGLSRATIYNLLKKNEMVHARRNFIVAHADLEREEAMQMQRNLMRDKHGRFRTLLQEDGLYSIVSQIPNSYEIEADRVDSRRRPRALSICDYYNNVAFTPGLYGESQPIQPLAQTHDPKLGVVSLWSSSSIQVPKTKPTIIRAKSIFSTKNTIIEHV